MTKRSRNEMVLLAGLLLVLGGMTYRSLHHQTTFAGLATDGGQFKALDVPDPSLRLDLLKKIRAEEYTGEHRNIFSAQPLPVRASAQAAHAAALAAAANAKPIPAGPPPLVVPATFFGIVTDLGSGNRRACFSAANDDVFILPEGATLLNQFKIVKIGSNFVELQEISTGRETTLTLALPGEGEANAAPSGGPQP